MYRKFFMAFAVAAAGALASSGVATHAMAWGAEFSGPGPRVTGNNTGGIFPYHPADQAIYRHIAETFCARYGRLGKVTSIHPIYGDYVSFVCIDKPWMIH